MRHLNNKDRDSTSSQGFTLIEVLVVMCIVGVLVTIATPSLLAMQAGTKLNNSLDKLRATIELSQIQAIQKKRPCTIYIPQQTKVRYRGGNKQIIPTQIMGTCTFVADNIGEGFTPDQGNGLPATNLDDGVFMTSDIPQQRIVYSPTGIVTIVNDKADNYGTIILSSDGNSAKKCLIINSGVGLIRTGDYIHGNECKIKE